VLTGVPIYYDWNRTADRLVVHTNNGSQSRSEHVTLMSISADQPGGAAHHVRADACRSRRRVGRRMKKHLAYIANTNAESYLFVADADGANPKSMASLPIGESSFVWAPDSRQHRVLECGYRRRRGFARHPDSPILPDAESKRLTGDDVAAYFYSPDGEIPRLHRGAAGSPVLSMELADLKSGKTRPLDMFLATQDESVAVITISISSRSRIRYGRPTPANSYTQACDCCTGPTRVAGRRPEPQLWVEPVDGPQASARARLARSRFISPAF